MAMAARLHVLTSQKHVHSQELLSWVIIIRGAAAFEGTGFGG